MSAVTEYMRQRQQGGRPRHPGLRVSPQPVRTTFGIELTTAGPDNSPHLILRGPNNRALWIKVLRQALEAVGDKHPAQVDGGPGGVRLLLPASANLHDLYDQGRRKV